MNAEDELFTEARIEKKLAHLTSNDPEEIIQTLLKSVDEFAENVDIPMSVSLKFNMVFDGLLNNIISYSYADQESHEISVRANLVNSRLVVIIEDDGVPFNPFTREDPDTEAPLGDRSIGGLGIHLVKNVMDEVSYKRHFNRNQETLVKQLDD